MLEADYIFLHTLLESGDPGRLKRAFTEMMRYQNEDGSWSIYPGGPGNISLSVKCYFSAKLMGVGPEDPRLTLCASGFLPTAAWSLATPLPRCTFARSASTTTTPCPPFRPRLFSSQLVLLQHLRDFVLVPLHSCSAGDHLRQKAIQEDSC